MSLKFPNGTVFGFSTALSAAIAVSGISNANPAIASIGAGAGIGADDVLVLTSGWSGINERVAVAGAVTESSVVLRGIDTSDNADYPSGGGAGSLVKASDWIEFNQQGELSTSGGEQQFWTGQFLEDRTGRQIQVPTFKNAKTFTLPLHYDPDQPWYAAAKRIDSKRSPVVLRMRLPDGDTIYRYGYLSFDSDPTVAVNTPMQNTMTFSALTEHTFIAADEEAGS